MKRPSIVLLRIASVSILGVFLVEALVVDGNGRVFGLDEFLSRVIVGGTLFGGIVITSVVLKLDVGWRILHFGCLVVYIVMILPPLIG